MAAPIHWYDYDLEGDEAGREAWRAADSLWQNQGRDRAARAADFLALYFGNTAYSLNSYRTGAWANAVEAPSFNLVQAFTDTLMAMIVRQKVRTYFLTQKGNWEQRERAEGMTLAVEAVSREAGIYDDVGMDLGFDGHLFEGAFLKCIPDFASSRVIGARTMPWAIQIPEREQRLPMPRQFFEVDTIDRGVMMRRCQGDKAAQQKIEDAPPAPWDEDRDAGPDRDGTVADLILYAECYHLPSGRVDRKNPRAWGYAETGQRRRVRPNHDGRRILVLQSGEVLDDDPWPFEYPPWASFRPYKKPNRYWSRGVPETIYTAQVAVHRMNQRVDAIANLHARPLLYIWKQAQVNPEQITNAVATILQGSMPAGQALQYISPPSIPADYVNRVEKIIAWAEKALGLSEQTIQANRPPGIDHAPALQMLQDIESIRQHPRMRAWESMHVQWGRLVVDALRMIAERNKEENRGSLELLWGESKHMKRIDWGKVDLEDSQFVIGRWPTNLLPSTPGAKLARLAEMAATGILTPQEARFVLASDYPDIEALLGDSNALVRNIQNKLDLIVRGNDPDRAMPHGYLHLELARTMVKERINSLEADGFPQDKLDKLIMWHEEIEELIARQAAANVSASAGAGASLDPAAATAAAKLNGAGATGGAAPAMPPNGAAA